MLAQFCLWMLNCQRRVCMWVRSLWSIISHYKTYSSLERSHMAKLMTSHFALCVCMVWCYSQVSDVYSVVVHSDRALSSAHLRKWFTHFSTLRSLNGLITLSPCVPLASTGHAQGQQFIPCFTLHFPNFNQSKTNAEGVWELRILKVSAREVSSPQDMAVFVWFVLWFQPTFHLYVVMMDSTVFRCRSILEKLPKCIWWEVHNKHLFVCSNHTQYSILHFYCG